MAPTKFDTARQFWTAADWLEIDQIAADLWAGRRSTGTLRVTTLASYIYFRRRGRR